MAAASKKIKKFVFTLNNYTPEEASAIQQYAAANATFAVIGHEVGEEGTPHLQGFMNLIKQSRFTAIKKIMPRAHLEVARGSDQDNLNYCSKQDKAPFIHGTPQYAGKRNDIADACAMIAKNVPLAEVVKEYPAAYVKYAKGLTAYAEQLQKPRDPNNPPQVLWIYGTAGVGKTRFAYDHLSADSIYIKDSTKWWDSYAHQYCILVDDFDGQWPYRDFLRFLDRYPYQGQFKGGYLQINSPVIIITCEFPPSHFWIDNELLQVTRRLTQELHLTIPLL